MCLYLYPQITISYIQRSTFIECHIYFMKRISSFFQLIFTFQTIIKMATISTNKKNPRYMLYQYDLIESLAFVLHKWSENDEHTNEKKCTCQSFIGAIQKWSSTEFIKLLVCNIICIRIDVRVCVMGWDVFEWVFNMQQENHFFPEWNWIFNVNL